MPWLQTQRWASTHARVLPKAEPWTLRCQSQGQVRVGGPLGTALGYGFGTGVFSDVLVIFFFKAFIYLFLADS